MMRKGRWVGSLAVVACGMACARAAESATFAFGVAVGDVTDRTAIFWTRADAAGDVRLQVSRDAAFALLDFERTTTASAESDLTVRIELAELTPATQYFYRFVHAGAAGSATDAAANDPSASGRFRTAPPTDVPAPLRIVFSGDTNFATAPFPLMSAAAGEDADLFIWFGDTIYADVSAGGLGPATTLADYRAKYRQVRSDEHVRALLASTALYAGGDDHEVRNDYAGADPRVAEEQKQAAYQAFFEYMPLRRQGIAGEPYRAYRRVRWGANVELFFLDARQYREPSAKSACGSNPDPDGFILGALTRDADCQAALRAPRSMLGAAQLDWLLAGLRDSQAPLKLVVNNVPLSYFGVYPFDRWDGYDAERRTILEFIDAEQIGGVVFLTTDIHANFSNPDVAGYFRRERADYSLPNGIGPAEVIVGPLGNTTLAGSIYGGIEGALGPAPLLTRLVRGAQGLATLRLLRADGLNFVHPNRESYALLDVDPQGRLRVTYRTSDGAAESGGRAESTVPETLFETSLPPATEARPALPCFLPTTALLASFVLLRSKGARR